MCPGHFPVTFRSWLRGRQSSPNWEVPAKEVLQGILQGPPHPLSSTLKALIPVWIPVQRLWATCWNWLGIHSITAVPSFFGTRDWFHGRQFFHRPGVGGDGFRMIRVLNTFTVNFTSNLMLTLVWHEVLVHSLEVGYPCSKGLGCVLHSDFLRNWPYHLSYAISSRKWGQISNTPNICWFFRVCVCSVIADSLRPCAL